VNQQLIGPSMCFCAQISTVLVLL